MTDVVTQPTPFRRAVDELNSRRFVRARRRLVPLVQGDGPERAWAGQELVQTFLRSGKHAELADFLTELLPEGSMLLTYLRAYADRRIGRAREARVGLDAIAGRRPKLWAADCELGWMECVSGDVTAGRRRLRRALRRFRSQGDDWGAATALTHLGTLELTHWKLMDAIELLEEAVELKRVCGDQLGEATCLTNLGGAHYQLANLLDAVDSLERALEIQRRIRYLRGEVFSLYQLGTCRAGLGDLTTAKELFRSALSRQRAAGGTSRPEEQAVTLQGLGLAILLAGGSPRQSLRHHEQAASLLADGPVGLLAGTVATMARILVRLWQPDAALERLSEFRERFPEELDAIHELRLEREEARAALEKGQLDRAHEMATKAVARGRALPPAQRRLCLPLLRARAVWGRVLQESGREAEAARALEEVSRDVDLLLDVQAGSTARMGTLETCRDIHDARVSCALIGEGGRERAWELASELKARELLLQVVRDDARNLSESAELRHLAGRDQLDERQLRRLSELMKSRGRRARSTGARSLRRLVSRKLGDGSALIEYHVSPRVTRVFVVWEERVECLDIEISEQALSRSIERLHRPLLEAAVDPDPWGCLQAFDMGLSHRLFKRLIAPVLELLSGRASRLVIVPDAALNGLAWELLVSRLSPEDEDDTASCEYLGDSHEVCTLPSAGLLESARRPRRGRDARLLALGYSPAAGPSDATGLAWSSLPEAEAEVASIAAVHAHPRVFVGADARAERYESEVGSSDVIHLACHGLSDLRSAESSGLVLAASGGEGSELFRANRIVQHQLPGSLVCLSACDTARGALRRHEGILGLARAFLLAGASAVLASRWPVDDATTRLFMTAFHRELGRGESAGQALTIARRVLRNDRTRPELAHPHAWAAFGLIDRLALS
ncbi:MAG: CHAT domain-containing tetratricopeptide repeat protein [Acidobacteriota bacterium]